MVAAPEQISRRLCPALQKPINTYPEIQNTSYMHIHSKHPPLRWKAVVLSSDFSCVSSPWRSFSRHKYALNTTRRRHTSYVDKGAQPYVTSAWGGWRVHWFLIGGTAHRHADKSGRRSNQNGQTTSDASFQEILPIVPFTMQWAPHPSRQFATHVFNCTVHTSEMAVNWVRSWCIYQLDCFLSSASPETSTPTYSKATKANCPQNEVSTYEGVKPLMRVSRALLNRDPHR